jgi:hypothetical protein
VSFGCDLEGLVDTQRPVERWDDCPAVSDDFEIAYAFITGRVEQLFDRLCADRLDLGAATRRPIPLGSGP